MVAQAIAAITLGLLGLAGVAKLADPDPTSGALESARLPSGKFVTRALGSLEVFAAVLGLAVGGVTVALGALLYLGFALFALSGVLKQRPIQSCGCFGRDDTPPSWLHVGYNVISTAMLGWVAAAGSPVIPWDTPFETIAYLGFAAIGVFGSLLLLDALPRTLAVVDQG